MCISSEGKGGSDVEVNDETGLFGQLHVDTHDDQGVVSVAGKGVEVVQ